MGTAPGVRSGSRPSSTASGSTGSTIRSSSSNSRRQHWTSSAGRSSSSGFCAAWRPPRPSRWPRSSGSVPRKWQPYSTAPSPRSATYPRTPSPGGAKPKRATGSNGTSRSSSPGLRSALAGDLLLDSHECVYILRHDKTRHGRKGHDPTPRHPAHPDDPRHDRGPLAPGEDSRHRRAERSPGHRQSRLGGVPPDAAPRGRHLMARKNHKHDNGAASAMDRLIERSVESALATWLSGQAVRATEQIGQELWADQEFRREFLETARAAAREALDRLRERRPR